MANYLLVCAAVIAVFWASLGMAGITLNFDFVEQYRDRIGSGFLLTVELSAASLVASMIIGVPVALGQSARLLPVRYLCDLYVKLVRGTPLLVQIYLFYYIIGTAWGIDNKVVAGVVILSVFAGAYIAEIVRGSLLSIDESQLEAARAVGFTRTQTVRHVVLPQLVARTLPALTGQFATIVKDSSLLSVIADHPRDHGHELQLLRRLSAAGRAVFVPDAAHHVREQALREEVRLCALGWNTWRRNSTACPCCAASTSTTT